jgi:branched-chain amino acid transport system substrate-binding protein
MADLTLVEEQFIAAAPETIFDLLGAGGTGGLFGASCPSFVRGELVHFDLPPGPGLAGLLQGTARVVEVRPPRRLVLEHETPWRGRLTCTISPVSDGSRVRLVATIPEQALRWLLRRRGSIIGPEADQGQVPIGLLVSQSGPGSFFAGATENLARLAVEEVNAGGPPTREPLRLVVGDDGTSETLGIAEARRLVEDEHCSVILACVTSATFEAISPVVEESGALLIYCITNEGGRTGRRLFRFGERPQDQLVQGVPQLMKATDSRLWYFAGNDYCWPRATHTCARGIVDKARASVVGETFLPLGTRDFSPLLSEISRSGAELVLSTFVGADAAAFERQLTESGLRERCQTLGPGIEDATREHMGSAVTEGLWAVFGYFADLPTQANKAFLKRYRARFGDCSPPPSTFSEATYETVHLVSEAARRARSWQPDDVSDCLVGTSFDGPRGTVTVRGRSALEQTLYMAEAVDGGFAVREAVS